MKITLKTTVEQELNFDTPAYRANDIKAVAILEDVTIAVTRITWMDGTMTTRMDIEPVDKKQAMLMTTTAARALLETDYKEITKAQFFQHVEAMQDDLMTQLLNLKTT
jgi:hypothetical protein